MPHPSETGEFRQGANEPVRSSSPLQCEADSLEFSAMKQFSFFLFPLLTASAFVGCASSTQELEYKMAEKEARSAERQERYNIRAESWDRRMQMMSENADARYRASRESRSF